jgi:hypothetical protein
MMLRPIAAFAFAALIVTTASAAELTPSTWKNDKGSTMQFLSSKADGGFTGNYTNNAPGYPRCAGVPYPLSGNSDGKKISFTVRWSAPSLENCNSTTTWTGTIEDGVIDAEFIVDRQDKPSVKGHVKFTRQ